MLILGRLQLKITSINDFQIHVTPFIMWWTPIIDQLAWVPVIKHYWLMIIDCLLHWYWLGNLFLTITQLVPLKMSQNCTSVLKHRRGHGGNWTSDRQIGTDFDKNEVLCVFWLIPASETVLTCLETHVPYISDNNTASSVKNDTKLHISTQTP